MHKIINIKMRGMKNNYLNSKTFRETSKLENIALKFQLSPKMISDFKKD